MLTIESIKTTLSARDVLEWLTETLRQLGFETTGWQDGRIQKTMLTTFARQGADFSELARGILDLTINDIASGVGLTIYSKSRFDNTRSLAVATAGPMTLTSTATVPYTITVGQLIAQDGIGTQFRNTTGGTITAGGTLVLQWAALKKGAAGNVGPNTVTQLVTSLAGVTVNNPPAGASPWFTTSGSDEESDRNLRRRNETKWGRLSLERVAASYENKALSLREEGVAAVEKVALHDDNPRGPGTLDVYVSGALATLGDSDMEAAQLAFSEFAWSTDDEWPAAADSRVAVKRPSTFGLSLVGVVYHSSNVTSAVLQQRVGAALDDFLSLLPLGGRDLSPGPAQVITLGDIYQVIENVKGVESVTLTSAYQEGNPPALGNITVPAFNLVTRPALGWFHALGLVATPVTS